MAQRASKVVPASGVQSESICGGRLNIAAKNDRLKAALGIRGIEFKFYRAGRAQWRVLLNDGEEFSVSTHNFGTESTVLRLAAERLAKMQRGVAYPKGA